MTHSKNFHSVTDYKKDINRIIDIHFNTAEKRVDEIYERYFSDLTAVFGRHWRHKKDIPYDIAAPLKYAYDFVYKRVSPNKNTVAFPRSGKVQEIERLISDELLSLWECCPAMTGAVNGRRVGLRGTGY